MSGNLAAQQSFAERFATVLRTFEREGGVIEKLASAVGEEVRDLRRRADGTKMPAHVYDALLAELPRHLADKMIRPSGLRLLAIDEFDNANSLLVAAKASAFSGRVAARHADGTYCHRDKAETKADAARLIADLQPLAGE